jgi:hemerythrin
MIDTQHKELIIAINDLADAIEQNRGDTAIKKLLVFMKYYAEWHFEHEESCAAKHQCKMAAANKNAHGKFISIFEDLQTQYRQSGASEDIARQAHAILSEWLVDHILKIDTQIGQCIQKHTAASTVIQA